MGRPFKRFQHGAPRHAAPEYGIRKNGKLFGITCLNLQEAEAIAEGLRKDGSTVEIFETWQGRVSGVQDGACGG
jgi:hypothetical protein